MIAIIISLVLLVVLILIAVRLIGAKRQPDEDVTIDAAGGRPLIHASGIYSIVRKSPRDDLAKIRPSEDEIRKYLGSQNEDINKRPLSHSDKISLVEKWLRSTAESVRIVEQGDAENVNFYYFDDTGEKGCPICAPYIKTGHFVTRQEIFNNPELIPPFHLGCTTRLVQYHGKDNLRETTTKSMVPFFKNRELPPLPEWKKIIATKP